MTEASVPGTRLVTLRVDGVRNLVDVEASPGPGFNLFTGRNGAGKTSVLEAAHVLAHGRSFRAGSTDTLIQRGREVLTIFAEVEIDRRNDTPVRERLGLSYGGAGWSLRHNDRAVGNLSDFVRNVAVVTLEPNSHELIVGPSEGRRRFLDWLLFHVEPGFLVTWRRYMRALRQRNTALRAGRASDGELSGWEAELSTTGESIHGQREALLAALEPELAPILAAVAPGLGVSGMRCRAGWPAGASLAEALRDGRGSDRERGFTQRGPHRADWRLLLADDLDHAQLSRGQAKLAAFACLLAQASLYRTLGGHWPVLSCDDLAAELDAEHQQQLLNWLRSSGAQILITGTHALALPDGTEPARMFHVEQGRLRQLV